MQSRSFRRVLFFAFLSLAGCLINSSIHAESGEVVGRAFDFKSSGVRFQLTTSIKADPTSQYALQNYDHGQASLAIKIRISAHARESRFFGEVTARVSDFSPINGAPEQVIWQDARCHQRRGLPKATVTAIDGSITREKVQIRVHARPRQMGLLLPLDEITPGTRLADGADQKGSFIAYRSQSKLSHLFVDVKIYAFDCDLAGKRLVSPAEIPHR